MWYVWGSLRFLLRLQCRGVVAVRLDRLGEFMREKLEYQANEFGLDSLSNKATHVTESRHRILRAPA